MNGTPRLEILICTYGAGGINKVASHSHPAVEGVGYVVCWQMSDGDCEIPAALIRDDFRIVRHATRGVSVNRNRAIDEATAPLAIMTDDDVDFTADEILSVIGSFDGNQQCDVLTFKYRSANAPKSYPGHSFDLAHPAKGYWASCIEMAFRVPAIRGRVRFNEHFGFNTDFLGGEDDLFIHDIVRAGIRGRFIPLYSCRHDGVSTGSREKDNPELVMTHGAIIRHIFPMTWLPRLIVNARRHKKRGGRLSVSAYLRHSFAGIARARRLGVFRQNG